jgi:penicillin-binding protein 1C
MDEVSGVAGAGPLFHAVMAAAMAHRAARPLPIERGFARVAVCPLSGGAPTPACGAHVLEWVPEAGPRDLAPCELHAEILVDRRNGLRAGPACAAAEPRVFERYPPELLAWATAAHRPLAPDAFSPLCPGEDPPRDGDGALHIAYPHDGARFLLDPDRPRALQAVSVLVSTETGTREVTLRVDGAAPVLLRAPFTHLWVMEPGDHTFAAEANGRTATVHVSVR